MYRRTPLNIVHEIQVVEREKPDDPRFSHASLPGRLPHVDCKQENMDVHEGKHWHVVFLTENTSP